MKDLKVENTVHYQAYWRGDSVLPEDGFRPVMFPLLSSNSVCTDVATCFDSYFSYYNLFINLGVFSFS